MIPQIEHFIDHCTERLKSDFVKQHPSGYVEILDRTRVGNTPSRKTENSKIQRRGNGDVSVSKTNFEFKGEKTDVDIHFIPSVHR